MEIEIRIEPHSYAMRYYLILWRKKKRFNIFNSWKRLLTVWDGAYISYDQPVMFSKFDDAVEYGKELKANPKLIEDHYKKQDKIYIDAIERREKYRNERNKTITIK